VKMKSTQNARTQTPSDAYYMKEKTTHRKRSEVVKEKPLSSYPIISWKVKHPSPSYQDQVNLVEGHYQGPTIQGVPNGHGKFIYLHAKDDTNTFSFVYVGSFLNGFLHGPGKKLDG